MAEVFPIIADFGHWLPAADSDVREATRITEGPVGTGTEWIQKLKVPGRVAEISLKVSSFDPEKQVVVDFDSPNTMRGTGTFSFSESDGKTTVRLDLHSSVYGLGYLFYPMIRMDLPKRERRRFDNLKRLIESGELSAPADAAAAAS